MLKKFICLLLTTVLLCAFPVAGIASGSDEFPESAGDIGILMTYISSYDYSLNISSSGLASCGAGMTAYPGTDKVSISMYLQKYDSGWSTVQHWTKEAAGNYVSLGKSYYVMKGYNYRVLVYFYAYEGSAVESLSRTATQYY